MKKKKKEGRQNKTSDKTLIVVYSVDMLIFDAIRWTRLETDLEAEHERKLRS